MRLVLLSMLSAAISFVATQALALPAPMSDDELLAKSDLVALIRVLSVTCTGVAKDERTGEALPGYKANAEVMEVIKGDVAKGDDVSITFHAVPTHILGPWTVYYYPGEMVFTHLVKERRWLHHDLVERTRQARQQGCHHRSADQGRRGSRGPAPHQPPWQLTMVRQAAKEVL